MDVVKFQIFEDVAASYPLTFEQLIERMIYRDAGEKPSNGLVAFVAGAVGDMVQSGVLLKKADMLSIPAKRTWTPKVKRRYRRPKIKVVDTAQTVLLFRD